MQELRPHRIAQVAPFAMTNDGKNFAFRITTIDGPSLDVEIATEKFGALVQYLVAAAASMASTLTGGFEHPRLPGINLSIPTIGVGIAATPRPDMMLLLTRHKTFDLAFEIPTASLEGLAKDLANAAKTMTADTAKRN